jgi:hypothetical protein
MRVQKNSSPNMILQLSLVPKDHHNRKSQVPIWGCDGPSAGTGTDDCHSAGAGMCQNGAQHMQGN